MTNYNFTKINHTTNSKHVLQDGFISVSKTGRIGLGKQFAEQYDLNTDSRANLYWDQKNHAVAVRFENPKTDTAKTSTYVKVQPVNGYTVGFVNGDAAYIASGSFFQKIGVEPARYTGHYQYNVLKSDDAGIEDAGDSQVFVVQLTENEAEA